MTKPCDSQDVQKAWKRFRREVLESPPCSTDKRHWVFEPVTPKTTEDGVSVQPGGSLLWWSRNPYNPHAGGGARVQTYADFMKRGPSLEIADRDSEQVLRELVFILRHMRGKKNRSR